MPGRSLGEFATDWLIAPDIRVGEMLMSYRHLGPSDHWTGRLGYATIDLNYKPGTGDILNRPAHRSEQRLSAQIETRQTLAENWDLTAGIVGYDGYSDYRSVWVDEYYRQLFEGTEGYVVASPKGVGGDTTLRWQYLPGSGFATVTLGLRQEVVAPGYEQEIQGDLQRGQDTLSTLQMGLGSEHVMTGSLRLQQDLEVLDTTTRPLRVRYGLGTIWVPGERWVTRFRTDLTRESAFHSVSIAASLEYDIREHWFLGGSVRAYTDNGQLENLEVISSGSPPLDTGEGRLFVRFVRDTFSLMAAAGYYATRYDAPEGQTRPFSELYRDRNWFTGQLKVNLQF